MLYFAQPIRHLLVKMNHGITIKGRWKILLMSGTGRLEPSRICTRNVK